MNELMRNSSACLSDIDLVLDAVWDNSAPGFDSSYSVRYLSKSGVQFLKVAYEEKSDSMSAIVASVEDAKYASRDEYHKTSVPTKLFGAFEGSFQERVEGYFQSLKEALSKSFAERFELNI